MPVSIALNRKLEEIEPRLRGVLFAILEEIERQREETVTKKEFNELKEIVKELAEAQKQAEIRLTRLEKVVEELAQAQKRTVEELQKLIKEHAKTREQLGGLSITVGYVLENEAMKALPTLLEQEFGLKAKGRFVRKFVKDKEGRPIEVNIIGEAVKNSKKIVIIGQSKLRLSKGDILEFLRDKIIPFEEIFEEIFPILITHMITQPDVEEYAYKNGIKRVYYSYEF